MGEVDIMTPLMMALSSSIYVAPPASLIKTPPKARPVVHTPQASAKDTETKRPYPISDPEDTNDVTTEPVTTKSAGLVPLRKKQKTSCLG